MSDWEMGLFKIKVMELNKPEDRTIGGWIKHPFAIDPRRYYESDYDDSVMKIGWVITHIPTGYVVRAFRGDLGECKAAADALLACADWDFSDAASAKERAPDVQKVMSEHPSLTSNKGFDQAIPLEGVRM